CRAPGRGASDQHHARGRGTTVDRDQQGEGDSVKITGEAALKASPEQLWEAFNDPVALVHTLPGCQRLETTGEDRYQMTISAGVAAIKGTYDGQVQLLDKVEPSSLRMIASGSGMPGTIEVGVAVNLTAK